MQAVVVRETGGPDVLALEEVKRPEPGDGEVLIRVFAASVNPVDWKYRRGFAPTELPAVLGNDVSGLVEVSHADGFAEGDEVFGIAASGAELVRTASGDGGLDHRGTLIRAELHAQVTRYRQATRYRRAVRESRTTATQERGLVRSCGKLGSGGHR